MLANLDFLMLSLENGGGCCFFRREWHQGDVYTELSTVSEID